MMLNHPSFDCMISMNLKFMSNICSRIQLEIAPSYLDIYLLNIKDRIKIWYIQKFVCYAFKINQKYTQC